jgi:transcriptional regulator with XRE-family HTH domain
VDEDLFIGDLAVSSVQTRGDLAALLRIVHVRADRPSLRALEARARHYRTPLSKTVVSEMLRDTRFPRKAVMLSFLRACGVAEQELEPWRRTWERVAARDQGATGDAANPFSAGTGAPQDTPGRSHPSEPAGRRGDQSPAPVTADRGTGTDNAGDPQDLPRAAAGPLISRRELGSLLRQLRFDAGLTIEQVAERLFCSPSKVSRMETGLRAGTTRDIRDLCDIYGVSDQAQRDYLMGLLRDSKKQGWWQRYDVPFGTYIGLESDATSISMFQPTVVPGLLQTAEYARAISASGGFSSELTEKHVAVRLRRQDLLQQADPPLLEVVVDEAALHRRVGGSAIMKKQLDQLAERSALPNVSVRVIPYAHGVYRAMDSCFCILEFPNQLPGIVYAEGLFGSIFIERAEDLERYRQAFLQTQEASISDHESTELIKKISSEMA